LDLHPTAPVIRRPGQISAWDTEDFVPAVKATRRKNLIMAGVTVEVCLAYPAQPGYELKNWLQAARELTKLHRRAA
jgi:hypothetical protein